MSMAVVLATATCVLATATCQVSAQETNKPGQLRCEYMVDPLGIDVAAPQLSWVMWADNANDRGQQQTAYQVLVATSTIGWP